mmetsp:Transcript_1894/g.4180  ORF Transcript_1894/g.4180 Transcript_1894/m.4180 type:complete len:259 (-) Transcript_1894:207-983(-)
MSKSITGNFLSLGLHLSNDVFHSSTLTEEDIDTTMIIHNLLQTFTFLSNVNVHLRNPNSVNVTRSRGSSESRSNKLGSLNGISVLPRCGSSEVSRVTSHNLMNNEHTRVGRTFTHDVFKEDGSLFSGSISSKSLNDGNNIVINGLWHTNDDNLSSVLFKNVLGQLGSLGVGIVSSNGVNDIDVVFDELLSSNFERSLSFLHESTGHAIFHVGELDTRVSNRTPTQLMKTSTIIINIRRNHGRISSENSLVPIKVHADR